MIWHAEMKGPLKIPKHGTADKKRKRDDDLAKALMSGDPLADDGKPGGSKRGKTCGPPKKDGKVGSHPAGGVEKGPSDALDVVAAPSSSAPAVGLSAVSLHEDVLDADASGEEDDRLV